MKKVLLIIVSLASMNISFGQGGFGNNGHHNHHGWTPSPSGTTMGMPNMRFEQLKRMMLQRRFDAGRIMLAKDAAMKYTLSSMQVRQLLDLFTFESTRLEFAKFASNRVADPGNFYLVFDAFSTPASIAALQQHIGGGTLVVSGGVGGAYGGYDGGGYGYNSGAGNGGGCHTQPVIVPISGCDFGKLLNSIEDAHFEDTRLSVARQALQYNWFTSAQVRDILDKFHFEDTRLEFAKCAYDKVVDPQNYHVLNDAFWFESTICELNKWINSR